MCDLVVEPIVGKEPIMCNLYSITTNQAAIIALFRVVNRYVGNLAPMPGVFPDYRAPIVRTGAEGRELATARWGMPSSQQALMEATKKRANKLEAKGKPVDFKELLRTGAGRDVAAIRSAVPHLFHEHDHARIAGRAGAGREFRQSGGSHLLALAMEPQSCRDLPAPVGMRSGSSAVAPASDGGSHIHRLRLSGAVVFANGSTQPTCLISPRTTSSLEHPAVLSVPAMSVISIQSQVAYGHVGNSVAVFPMQMHGIDVVAVPTTLLSNRPGYPTIRGRVLDAELVADLLLSV